MSCAGIQENGAGTAKQAVRLAQQKHKKRVPHYGKKYDWFWPLGGF